MATDDQVTRVCRASDRDWMSVSFLANGCSRCILELRDRVEALEAAAKTAALLVPKEGSALVVSEDAFQALEAAGGRAPDAPAGGGLTVEQLANCLPVNAWQGPEGYSRMAFAQHLLSHPITGTLLRGEGAPAPKRVVLAERPPLPEHLTSNITGGLYRICYVDGYVDGWVAASAEVERQQQGGHVDA